MRYISIIDVTEEKNKNSFVYKWYKEFVDNEFLVMQIMRKLLFIDRNNVDELRKFFEILTKELTNSKLKEQYDKIFSEINLTQTDDFIEDLSAVVAFDRISMNSKYREMKHLFFILFEDDIPICSVNVFKEINNTYMCGMYAIHSSSFSYLTGKYKNIGREMINEVYKYMIKESLSRLVIPVPFPAMEHILITEGFIKYNTDNAPIDAKEFFGFITNNFENYFIRDIY